MKTFWEQWKVLMTRKDDDDPNLIKISKAFPVIKWVEIHLAYGVHLNAVVVAVVPPLELG